MIAGLVRSIWFRALVTAAVLWYLLRHIDGQAALESLGRLAPGFALAVLALLAVDRTVMVLRWIVLLRASRTPLDSTAAARIYFVTSFAGSLLPASVGTDTLRAYAASRQAAGLGEVVASIAVDRLIGLFSIVLLGVVGAIVWTARGGASAVAVPLLGLLLGIATVSLLWADRAVQAAVPRRWRSWAVSRRLLELGDAVGRYRGRRGALISVLALSIGVQLLRIAQAYLLGRGIGIGVGFAYYLLFMPVGLLMLLLPVSISGFGLPQGVIVWLLRPVGVPDAEAFALSTLIVLTGLVGNLPGAWLYLRPAKT